MYRSFGLTDIGFYRKKNEDAFAQLHECAFFVLADGLGGHPSGDVASSQAVEKICTLLEKSHVQFLKEETDNVIAAIEDFIEQTNIHIYNLSQSEGTCLGMGTTLCCLYFFEKNAILAHVGDSRIYRLRGGHLEQLTSDHSFVQELLDQGLISEQEGFNHRKKNVITKAIGIREKVNPTIQITKSKSKDLYLLCSDGVHDALTNEEIQHVMAQGYDLEICANLLVNAAKKRGSRDNITVLFIQLS
jgi:protein phosphatase